MENEKIRKMAQNSIYATIVLSALGIASTVATKAANCSGCDTVSNCGGFCAEPSRDGESGI